MKPREHLIIYDVFDTSDNGFCCHYRSQAI
jgi:hypothetical protein